MDRVKAAALQQGDANLQMPIITPVASEAWGVKKLWLLKQMLLNGGSQEERGIDMEVETAMAVIAAEFQCGNPETSGIHQDHFWSDERISLRVALRRRCNYGT
ncbi:MAG: hypothetical protein ACLTTO_08490 [Lachnospiraceae bacterium]